MKYCKPITKYDGTKSERIVAMINDKMKKHEQPRLKEYVKDAELIRLTKRYLELKKEKQKVKEQLNKRKDELGIEWYSGKYSITSTCRVPPKDFHDLQRASNLHSVSKYKESKKIWDRIMKKHNLF